LAVGYEKRFPSEILLQAGAPERLDRSLLEGVSGVVMAGGASLGGESAGYCSHQINSFVRLLPNMLRSGDAKGSALDCLEGLQGVDPQSCLQALQTSQEIRVCLVGIVGDKTIDSQLRRRAMQIILLHPGAFTWHLDALKEVKSGLNTEETDLFSDIRACVSAVSQAVGELAGLEVVKQQSIVRQFVATFSSRTPHVARLLSTTLGKHSVSLSNDEIARKLSAQELVHILDRLLHDQATPKDIDDWIRHSFEPRGIDDETIHAATKVIIDGYIGLNAEVLFTARDKVPFTRYLGRSTSVRLKCCRKRWDACLLGRVC
jgi:hypothetical protein